MNHHDLRRIAPALATALGVAFSPAPSGAAQSPTGRLYGTVETASGARYTGVLRWGREEAFWDDLFNASKSDEPATGELPEGYERPTRKVEVFGLKISGPWESAWSTRQFVARFGDIAEIRPQRGEKVEVQMKSGTVYRLSGGSNDVGADIHVRDASLGDVTLDWEKVRRVRFAPTPGDVRPEGERLHAWVKTTTGDFEGSLQWDSEECLTTDVLDGETADGEVDLPMGKVRSISRVSRHASRVALADGRTLELSGTNDVDGSIRGILIEDARYGRVEIPWEVFVEAVIEPARDSGPAYGDFPSSRKLAARVRAVDGKTVSGAIAFDLDETETWELLNGSRDDVVYSIPFSRIRSIRPQGKRAEVELAGGEKLVLEGATDVSEENAGVAFLGAEKREGSPDYLRWTDVESIELE